MITRIHFPHQGPIAASASSGHLRSLTSGGVSCFCMKYRDRLRSYGFEHPVDFDPSQPLDPAFHTCQYCGSLERQLVRDHVIPVSKGGSDHPKNIRMSCDKCNLSKGPKDLEVWRERRAGIPNMSPQVVAWLEANWPEFHAVKRREAAKVVFHFEKQAADGGAK